MMANDKLYESIRISQAFIALTVCHLILRLYAVTISACKVTGPAAYPACVRRADIANCTKQLPSLKDPLPVEGCGCSSSRKPQEHTFRYC